MKILDFAKELFRMMGNTIYYYTHPFRKYIIINSWAHAKMGKLQHDNFGDELNVYLIEELTGKKVKLYNDYFHLPQTNYLVIGSLVERFCDSKTIIWGSGAIIGNNEELKNIPHKVTAVRGKYTMDYLTGKGIECPHVYGDPALLAPLVYNPSVSKKWDIGIIPHVSDLDLPIINDLSKLQNVHIIRFKGYDDWHDVIREIKQCNFIISSSLHGLILSDAYNIPNMRVVFSNNIIGGDFKYLDYYSAVNRKPVPTLRFQDTGDIQSCLAIIKEEYTPISINLQLLLDSCPFAISDKYGK